MASKYTCTACLRALRGETRRYTSIDLTARFARKNCPSQLRTFSGSSIYYAVKRKAVEQPASATISSTEEISVERSRAPEFDASLRKKLSKTGVEDADTIRKASDAQIVFAKYDPEKGLDYYKDETGELHTPALIPDDVRTYKWSSAEWTWGVLERLFQGCEQAKMTYELEDYVEEETGKTKKRVIRDENGQNKGIGEGWWFEEIGLPKTFNTWITVCFLHMWILQVRIRHFPTAMSKHWTELLTNHCFWEAEKTMDLVQKLTASERSKYLKDYFEIWRGTILAYDEGLVKGDAVLAAAVWRMLFDAKEDVDPVKIALVTAYMRKEVARVGLLGDKVLANGWVGFGEPVKETDILMQSPLMKLPFDTAVERGGSVPDESAKVGSKQAQKGSTAAIAS